MCEKNIIYLDSKNEMPKASASPSSSVLSEENDDKKELLDFGNSSFLKGYDEAINILNIAGKTDSADILKLNRSIIESELNNNDSEL